MEKEKEERQLCDKGISWIDSCRECVFNVLCMLDENGQTLFFKNHKNDNRQK